MWTEYSGWDAPLPGSGVRPPACRFRALRDTAAASAGRTSRSSMVTTVLLNSCFSHCVAPMRMRSPTAISSGSVTRPSRSRLTSMTARFASGGRGEGQGPLRPAGRGAGTARGQAPRGSGGSDPHRARPGLAPVGVRLRIGRLEAAAPVSR